MNSARTALRVLLLLMVVAAGLAARPISAATTPSAPGTVAAAATANSIKTPPAPDPGARPALAGIMRSGAKLYYLGTHAGLDGWLITKDGQMQIAYTPVDGQAVLIGVMFGPNGENLTGDQMKTLFDTNMEVKNFLSGALQQSANTLSQAITTAPAATAPAVSPGERLYHDLSAAPGVTIGNTGAPKLLMVMDPTCKHCQAAWHALRESVFKNTLQIRLIPIGRNTDDERPAALLLHVADPLNAWDKYVSGDAGQLAGTPDPGMIAAVHANHALIDSWNIGQTPYMVYRAKDGKVKIVQGEPATTAAMLGDIGP